MQQCTVLFQPDNIRLEVDKGTDLLTAARQAGIEMKASCGGKGSCGKCRVKVVKGSVDYQDQPTQDGWVAACQTLVLDDPVVEIPASSRLNGHQVLLAGAPALPASFPLKPLCRTVRLEVVPPSLTDPGNDLDRLCLAFARATGLQLAGLELEQIRSLPDLLRRNNWRLDLTYGIVGDSARLIGLEVPAGDAAPGSWGIAVDVGTTTVAVYLVDLASGTVAGQAGTHNKQAQFGDDVISRIIYADEQENGLADLQQAVLDTMNGLIQDLISRQGIQSREIKAVTVAANTTMTHLIFGIQPRYIRLEPYVPAVSSFPVLIAGELGLTVHPQALVYAFPAVASYVGGDIVAGSLINGMTESEALTLFLDIGTNGEMALGNQDWIVTCACSAGPAFEGAGITDGMRAMPGAIEGISIDPATYEVTCFAIDGAKPVGICGSGLINALSAMRQTGIIDRAGKIQDLATPRLRRSDGGMEYVLVWAGETAGGRDIVITEADVKNLLRAKGAVYAGLRSLLKAVDLELDSIERICIAGGFGNCLNVAAAVEIGLLPDVAPEKYHFLGNTSVKGAYTALVSSGAVVAAEDLARRMTYLELSLGNGFMEEFMAALFLPHTDLTLFPSIDK
ncbi:ASKHA domain-containing protein [Acetonema longum]|uniref:Ferredoxin n=1 Tax=Acetonema longum DSM 6540 TaxID=1009370 RepID=F7NGT1_9FIRM|nr:ASKHA domain-containing protein [Acetonema longum]EGO64662.1 ferredoxin [Acetonema longum DSM 6540]